MTPHPNDEEPHNVELRGELLLNSVEVRKYLTIEHSSGTSLTLKDVHARGRNIHGNTFEAESNAD